MVGHHGSRLTANWPANAMHGIALAMVGSASIVTFVELRDPRSR
jgi:hypothetical protein